MTTAPPAPLPPRVTATTCWNGAAHFSARALSTPPCSPAQRPLWVAKGCSREQHRQGWESIAMPLGLDLKARKGSVCPICKLGTCEAETDTEQGGRVSRNGSSRLECHLQGHRTLG